ncbi:hypothetical protein [Helicobacter pylori]|uniref:hypothetical protein n=1 Tax=Helicobacter pylori TaxID=210 RepID=UPI0013F3AAED|nr:hypothetical protein [Helicobacter pylori]NHB53479.1 hypothetical protein [Helicobacter pylori]
MHNDLKKAILDKPIVGKLHLYLKRREIIFNYAKDCVGELVQKLESAEIENATLILTFKDNDSMEKFNENKEDYYLPHFREIYLDAKRRIETLGIEASFYFTNIEAKIKPIKERPKRTIFYKRPINPINIDVIH